MSLLVVANSHSNKDAARRDRLSATVSASNASKPNRLLSNPAILRSAFFVIFPLA
jgi:hypothetical protein